MTTEMPNRHRAADISLDSAPPHAARKKDINISKASGARLRAQFARHWQDNNARAIEVYNAYVDEHGLPLAQFRLV